MDRLYLFYKIDCIFLYINDSNSFKLTNCRYAYIYTCILMGGLGVYLITKENFCDVFTDCQEIKMLPNVTNVGNH